MGFVQLVPPVAVTHTKPEPDFDRNKESDEERQQESEFVSSPLHAMWLPRRYGIRLNE